MNGEETSGGRAFAHALDGTSWELPRLGKLAFENAGARRGGFAQTVVISQDDTSGSGGVANGEVYVYIGTKQASGTPVEKAGLTTGGLYGIKVRRLARRVAYRRLRGRIPPVQPLLVRQRRELVGRDAANGLDGNITKFLRPEDGSWDPNNPPNNPSVYYFVTTDRPNSATQVGRSRLWQLTFSDVSNPAAGGTITMLLDGTEGQEMLDNLTVNDRGQLLLQEDVGENARLGKAWLYDSPSDTLTELARAGTCWTSRRTTRGRRRPGRCRRTSRPTTTPSSSRAVSCWPCTSRRASSRSTASNADSGGGLDRPSPLRAEDVRGAAEDERGVRVLGAAELRVRELRLDVRPAFEP